MNARCVRGGPYAPPACIDKVDDLTPERLTENVAFLDAVAFATTAAVTTGRQEKLDALRSAVLNAAAFDPTSDITRRVFDCYR